MCTCACGALESLSLVVYCSKDINDETGFFFKSKLTSYGGGGGGGRGGGSIPSPIFLSFILTTHDTAQKLCTLTAAAYQQN